MGIFAAKRHKRDEEKRGFAADFGGCFLRWGGLGWCVLTPASEAVSQLYGFSLEKSIFNAGHVIMACVGMIERDF